MREAVLVTGGLGYIGSHTVVKLLEANFDVIILDNLSNSKSGVMDRIKTIVNKSPKLIIGDVRDRVLLRNIFSTNKIKSVIHFAGLKAVGESENFPLRYYDNNVIGSIALLEEMEIARVRTLVFSSSATVYGNPGCVQYSEDLPLNPVNAYGRTKLITEDLLKDLKRADSSWRIAILRYFNPVGAHKSGLIGEDPNGLPNNLMPYISQVAVGIRDKLMVFGGDYDTNDGTGRRDFIHVEDLAKGHMAALNVLNRSNELLVVNLGSGKSHSVLELIRAFEVASGKSVKFEIVERRPGDLPEYYAVPDLAKTIMNWEAELGIDRICEDTWRWQSLNPRGYVV